MVIPSPKKTWRMQEEMQNLYYKNIPAGRLGTKTEGKYTLLKGRQIKNNLDFSGIPDFYDVENELLPGNVCVICQYLSQSMKGRGNGGGGQVTLAAA